MRFSLCFGAAALAIAAPATSAWQQASSKHFIIYGDMPAEEMKAYAEKLEKFDAAARLIRSMKDPEVEHEKRDDDRDEAEPHPDRLAQPVHEKKCDIHSNTVSSRHAKRVASDIAREPASLARGARTAWING